MKRKITAALVLTLSVMSVGNSVFAQSTDAIQTQTNKTSLEQNIMENSSIITGIVKSVNGDSITIETMAGGRGGFKNISSDEGERPEKSKRPVIAEGSEGETADFRETRIPKERPERENPDTEAIDIEKTEREKPESEEKTITVTSSTLIYKADSSDKTQIDLSEISEGNLIRVQISEDSDKSSDTVSADEIICIDADDMPV